MDCFKDFYEYLESLPAPEPDDYTVDLTNAGISEEYFEKVDHASSMIAQLFDRYINTDNMQKKLHERIRTGRYKNRDDVKLCLMIDIVRCYYGLDHRTSLNTPEGIALLLLLVKLFREDYTITYSGLSEIPSSIINLDGLVTYISDCSDEIDIPSDQCVLTTILQDKYPSVDRSYRIALYRFCEAISEVDGVISVSEREFLMALLRLDDEDVTNDIDIDSIFNREQ